MVSSTLIALALAASPAEARAWSPPPLLDAPTTTQRRLSLPPMVEADVSETTTDARRHWAVMMEAGVPDGAVAGVAWEPVSFMRLTAAALTNGSAIGGRGGIALQAPAFMVRPSIGLDVGHVFEGDAQLALAIAGSQVGPLLGKVTYDFASASIGADLGSERFALLIRLGASYVDVRVPDAAAFLSSATGEELTGAPFRVRLLHPSARLGLVVGLD